MIRIGVVDDHKVFRAGLRAYLGSEPDFDVVGEAADGREAVELVRSQEIDVLLMDLSMPGQSGLDVLAMIRAKAPRTRIVILTGSSESQYAVKLIRSGAAGFLGKDGDPIVASDAGDVFRTAAAGDVASRGSAVIPEKFAGSYLNR